MLVIKSAKYLNININTKINPVLIGRGIPPKNHYSDSNSS